MSGIQSEISSVLAQIRELNSQITGNSSTSRPAEQTENGFGTAFREAIDAVSAQQKSAEALTQRFQEGDPNTSIAQVVVEMQKASISFQAMSEARNRIVDAYREIMNMSV